MKQEIIDLFDEYTHKALPRRVFFKRLVVLAGGTAAATALLPLLENNYAKASMVAEDDPQLSIETVTYPGADGTLSGYLARPKAASEDLPKVIVIHENRGLNAYVKDVVRRTALAGYEALGTDFLSTVGGTPTDEDKAREMISALDAQQTLGNLKATLTFLQSRGSGKVGCVGFCWGGGMTNQLAVNAPDLGAAVAFYGSVPAAESVPNIQAPLLLHYAGLDERINQGIPAYEAALRTAGKTYTICMYGEVNHAFHNDTNEARYDANAAQLSWERTIAFFDYFLKS
ncbi:MAG: dienelactone hydrolase family protein [Oscillatoriophycideae cyanobacterium NC_groundwater_1537_Pr4_S-0.65um_50_18]|nr:dienelactone hydrolase family protein [Oscillatoriophycideae cyanobacterium NC_groundwater_1537_Pr4_S-0.65um_50_18]